MTKGELLLNQVQPNNISHIRYTELDRKVDQILKFCDVDTKLYAGFNFWYYLTHSKNNINSFTVSDPKEKDYVGSLMEANVFRLYNNPNTLLVVRGLKVSVFHYDFNFSKRPISDDNGALSYPYDSTSLLNLGINVHNFIRWAIDNKRRMIVEILRVTIDSVCNILRKSHCDWETLYIVMNHDTWRQLINDTNFISHYAPCNHFASVQEGIFGDFIFDPHMQPAVVVIDVNRVFPELKEDRFIIISNSIRGSSTYDVKINGEFDD